VTLAYEPRERTRGTDLIEGLDALRIAQFGNGEMLSYMREPNGGLVYARSPLFSTFVHDALGCFAPRSPAWEQRTLAFVETAARGRFVWTASWLRRRIRRYLAWQAESDGTWRFFGRGSGLPADAITTASAAVALLESPGRAALARRGRHMAAIERFRSAEGLYHTFILPGGDGCGWWDEAGRPVAGFEPVVNAEVLRFLVLTGARSIGEVAPLIRYLRDQAASGEPPPAWLFPNPLCFFSAVARAWSQAGLPDADGLAADLVPRVLAMQDESGGFGGPLASAMAVTTLLDLGYEGGEVERGVLAVAGGRLRWGGWGYDDMVVGGYGSPALTTALSITALARGGARLGGDG
jgi:hypothetical protein